MPSFKSFSQFTISKKLASGAFGDAFAVKSASTGHEEEEQQQQRPNNVSNDVIVLKRISLKHSEFPANVVESMCIREAFLLRHFDHDNIVKGFGCFKESSAFFILMEYIPGGDLWQYLIHCELPIPENVLAMWSRQLLDALACIHAAGYIHCDVKCGNIFLSSDKRTVKIGDFGLARKIGSPSEAGMRFGTAHYMAPEVITDCKMSPRGDIWSLGCALYMLANNTDPFVFPESEDISGIFDTIIKNQPMQFVVNRLYSQPFQAFVMSMLRKNENFRPSAKRLLKSDFLRHKDTMKNPNYGISD